MELLQVGGTMGLWLGLGVVQVMFWNGWFWLCVFCVLLVLFVYCLCTVGIVSVLLLVY